MKESNLIEDGYRILEIRDISEKKSRFQEWRERLLSFYNQADLSVYKEVMLRTHFVENEFSQNDSLQSMTKAVTETLSFLVNKDSPGVQCWDSKDALVFIQRGLDGFYRYIKAMYQDPPHKRGILTLELLNEFSVGNEYDIQRMLYAWLRPVFPTVRTEVNSDNGYSGMRADLYLEEYDLIIEVKCTRPSMSEKMLTEELGADCFHYHAKNLYIYVYDKENLIKNPEAYKAAFRRSTKKAGKEIQMFINPKY